MADAPEILFGIEPPPPKPRVTEMQLICAQLREHQGEWALIRQSTGKKTCESYAGNLKSGLHAGNFKGEFDAKVAELPAHMQSEDPTDDTLYGVWAMYVGGEPPVEEAPPLDSTPDTLAV